MSHREPWSIHQLHINDIGVVMALGDSITAGFNKGTAGTLNEYRGRSWSIGGDRTKLLCLI